MLALLRSLAVLAILSVGAYSARAEDKDQTENPYYKHWSKWKVGSSIELKETTKTPGMKGEPEDVEVKVVVHTLLFISAEKAVVETTVTEGEIFGFVQSAPTKHIYPAKMSKELLQDLLKETGAKGSPSTVKVGAKELKATLLTGVSKKGEEEADFKIWLSDEVPGGIARRVRLTKHKGELVAETTVEVVSFK
jgi:hypothetical protein